MPIARVAKRSGRKKESAYEAAKRLGLIGCIDGPPDLALNHRKYRCVPITVLIDRCRRRTSAERG